MQHCIPVFSCNRFLMVMVLYIVNQVTCITIAPTANNVWHVGNENKDELYENHEEGLTQFYSCKRLVIIYDLAWGRKAGFHEKLKRKH